VRKLCLTKQWGVCGYATEAKNRTRGPTRREQRRAGPCWQKVSYGCAASGYWKMSRCGGLQVGQCLLEFGQSRVGDLGIAEAERLQTLWLENTQITDAGLVHLSGLTSLQELDLPSQITDAGLAKLKEALPNCDILR